MGRPPLTVTLTYYPDEMATRGRIGAHVTHSRHDSRELTAPARSAFLAAFERQVDPAGALSEAERQRRAEHARKAHMARLALASVRARRNRLAESEVPDASE